jgi:Pvc16 N-terminal domain
MGVYTGLHEMARSVTAFLRSHGGTFTTATNYGPPMEKSVSTTEAVRVTLLWATPQPTHRNDAPHRTPAGAIQPPPLTLSAFLMITTYGGGELDPAIAYEMLGTILRIFHEKPVLTLPIDGVGEGTITVTAVPMAADLMEKLFSPLQTKHRPFAVFEVAPVQIRPTLPATTGAPPVKPGGLRLDVTSRPAPEIVRVTPERQVPGGAVRIDLDLGSSPLGQVTVAGAPVTATPLAGAPAVRVVLPPTLVGGEAPIAVRTNPPPGQWAERHAIGLLPPATPTLDAPAAATASLGAPSLALTGRGLTGASLAMVWPDRGTPGDGDVRELALSAVTATSVAIPSAELSAKLSATPTRRSLIGVPLRLVVRLPSGSFTPYVLVEVRP